MEKWFLSGPAGEAGGALRDRRVRRQAGGGAGRRVIGPEPGGMKEEAPDPGGLRAGMEARGEAKEAAQSRPGCRGHGAPGCRIKRTVSSIPAERNSKHRARAVSSSVTSRPRPGSTSWFKAP